VVLNEREKVIAWVVGAVGGAALLYFGANMLYFTPVKELEKKNAAALKKKADIEDTVKKAKLSYNEWTNMYIQSSPEAIEGPTRTRIYQLAEQNYFQINTYSGSNPRSLPKQPDFQEVVITASADTTTSRLARFLVMLESQHDLAMRVEKLNIQSKKPGSDDLHVDMQIRTLLYAPKDKKLVDLRPPPSTPPVPGVNTGTPRNTGVRTAATGAAGTGQVASLTPAYPQYTYSILNAPLGSLDPAIPGDDKTSMEERLKMRRQYQVEGKPLGKPRFGEAPLELLPGETPEQAMARRKAEQMKAAATQAAAEEELKKKAEEANAPKLLPGETMEQYLIRHRKEQDALDNATTTKPAGGN
jgi:hypothetical protein